MKALSRFAILLLGAVLLFASCEKAPFVTMTGPGSYSFTREGGSETFTFSCNREWSVSSSQSWLRISPSSGKAADGDITATITCAPNTTYDFRTATITLKVEELTETISVSQDTGLGLILSPTTFDLTNSAQTIEVEVQQNVFYAIEIDEACKDWIKRGGTKALSTDKITFTIAANTSYDNREGKITFKQTDGDLVQTVTVRQSQTNGLFITTPDYNLSNEAHTISVEVKANVEFEVTSQTEWIKFVETKALTPSTITLSVEANETYVDRIGTVLVKQKNGDLTGTITVNQKQTDYMSVSPTSFEVTNAEQTVDVVVTDNVSYSVVIPDDAKSWISIVSNTQTKALTDDKVILAVSQNLTYDPRTASITIKQTDGPLAETVEIKQAQGNGLFVTTPEYNLSNEAHTLSVELKANVEFEVTSEADWITYVDTKALSASTVTLSVATNEGYDNRTGKVKIKQKNGSLEETVTINQKQTDYLSVTPTSFELTNAEQTVDIEVKDNVSYDIVIPDEAKSWISINSNTQTKAIVDDKIVLIIAKNTAYDDREASVTIKQVDGALAGTVKIKQAYGEGLFVSPDSFNLDSSEQVIDILIQNNISYSVVISDDAKEWISLSTSTQTKALADEHVLLKIEQNTGHEDRESTITIKQNDGPLAATVIIKQDDGDFLFATKSEYEISNEAQYLSVEIQANVDYEAKSEAAWISIVETKGPSSSTIMLSIEQNESYSERTGTVKVEQKGGDLHETISITQRQTDGIIVTPTSFNLTSEQQTIQINVESNTPYSVVIQDDAKNWIQEVNSASTKALNPSTVKLSIAANTANEERTASVTIKQTEGPLTQIVSIKQGISDYYYESSDYSINGTWKKLQSASTSGQGLNLVFMGDAYTDKQIKDGTYDADMTRAMEHFFEVEPYASLRNMFNCYQVYAVSKNNNYMEGSSTVFNCQFGEGTRITGYGDKVRMYAQKIDEIQNGGGLNYEIEIDGELFMPYKNIPGGLVCIVVLNSTKYSGTCSMYTDGVSIAWCALQDSDESFAEVIHHEAGGHGFGLLADEYDGDNETLDETRKADLQYFKGYGFYQNIDITNNPETILWSKFLSDSRYSSETGIYEGAYYCNTGVWRPSENSIMRYNTGGYNAPSREIIYRRAMELCYGPSYTYNFEDFASFDAAYRAKMNATANTHRKAKQSRSFVPYAEPTLIISNY